MKSLETSFASRVRLYVGALVAILLAGSVVQSGAAPAPVSVSSGIYTLTYDPAQNAFTGWSINGVNQLVQQSLWYNTGSGITQLTGAAVNSGSSGHLNPVYFIQVSYPIFSGMSIVDTMTLNGNTLGESIQFLNNSGSTVNMSLFQFSDFVLGGPSAAGQQSAYPALSNPVGASANVTQYGGGVVLGWSGFDTANGTSGTTAVQADGSGALFGPFIGSGTDLNNSTVPVLNTQAVFGFEYSGSVDNNQSLTVSATAVLVPEPSSLALISSGMLALALITWRRKDKKHDLKCRLG